MVDPVTKKVYIPAYDSDDVKRVLGSYTIGSTTIVTVSDTIITGGNFYGVAASSTAVNAVVKLAIARSTVEGTNRSIYAYAIDGSATISVSSTLVHNNSFGWYQAGPGAVIRSLGNNHISDNGSTFGVLTPTALQ